MNIDKNLKLHDNKTNKMESKIKEKCESSKKFEEKCELLKQSENKFNILFMERAIELARKGSLVKKTGGPFGAVIVKDSKIIGEGYNTVLSKKDPTCHAEIVAIRKACKLQGNIDLSGSVIYSSGQCCPMCYSACVWSNIGAIFYASTVEDATKYGSFRDEEMYIDLQNKDASARKIPSFNISQAKDSISDVWKQYHESQHDNY